MLEMLKDIPGFYSSGIRGIIAGGSATRSRFIECLYKANIYPHNWPVKQGNLTGWPHRIMLPCPTGWKLPDIAL
ncbi:MAG: hypothetical protein ACREWI_01085 [Telluria sp.]